MKTIKNLKAEEIRKSILQLAIQGKLVKQNPNDEPASELVKKIYEEKKKLIAEGKIKKDKNESFIFKGDDNCYYEKIGNNEPVKLENLPFDIPDNWTWIRLKSLANIYNGNSINDDEKKRKYTNVQGRDFIATKDVSFDRTISYNNGVNIPFDVDGFKVAPAHKILLCIEGGSAGRKIAITDKEVCFGNKLACFDTILINDLYLFNLFQSNEFASIFKSSLTGIIGGVSINTLKNFTIPLPPLEEQQRIVDKINSFEQLIQEYDKYEKQLTELESTFADKLKKSILQYAIEGKLVKQDPNDEPASVLLERIKAEKEQLIKEGKIKRDKNESYIYQGDDKNYYENLPQGWILTTYSAVLNSVFGGGTPSKTNLSYWNGDISWCSVKDLGEKLIIMNTIDSITIEGLKNSSSRMVEKGDLILCTRMAVGKLRIAGKSMAINQDLKGLVTSKKINKLFFIMQVNATNFIGSGTTVKGLQIADFMTHAFILPPLKEQSRIVNKIDDLFSLLFH